MNYEYRKKIRLFTGTANPKLANDIARYLELPMGKAEVGRFQDGEINVRIGETVRGAECFVIQPTCAPADTNLMEILIMIDALKRASAKSITAVIPYYGYARQDRKLAPHDPIVAKLVADLITTAGADRILTMDLHAGQIQGFFDGPVDNLKALPILTRYFLDKNLGEMVVVSPDVGGVARARELSERLHAPLAIMDKRRPSPNVAEIMHVIGEVGGGVAILMDDIIDTGGTIIKAAEALLAEGAREVYACATHPVFSGDAYQRLERSVLKEIVVTDSIPLPPERANGKVRVLTVAPLFAQAIRHIFEEISVSQLFEV
ncbi:ribose-phosphate diphosphokinase [Limnochorda pilosa]|uniref:Ribose-phosphate pyrophosphokinase n=1 Tax=Limnochorda pilosa TaxID=1555112 RepID=A0A0K2SQX1_LIMPI|nr:ribose-phosphate pyrophosphokinase [Limnochorda pilosa]BAS29407.1 ribose-phosphate pyrophosphokinase [Limnochorda pilosa]